MRVGRDEVLMKHQRLYRRTAPASGDPPPAPGRGSLDHIGPFVIEHPFDLFRAPEHPVIGVERHWRGGRPDDLAAVTPLDAVKSTWSDDRHIVAEASGGGEFLMHIAAHAAAGLGVEARHVDDLHAATRLGPRSVVDSPANA